MEASTRTLILALAVFAAAVSVLAKDSDDGAICGVSRDELLECKPAVAAGVASPPPPTDACCTALKHANLTCFCTFKNNMFLGYLRINATRAMLLPSKCDSTVATHC